MKKMILIMTWMTVQLYGTFMYAQSDFYKKDLEPSVLECKYELVMQFDTVDVSLRKDMMILRMGENVSQFYAYSAFYSARKEIMGATNAASYQDTEFCANAYTRDYGRLHLQELSGR